MSSNSTLSSLNSAFLETGNFTAFGTVFTINLVLGVAIFTVFSILRVIKPLRYFFAPRYYDEKELNINNLPNPGKWPLSWLLPTLRYSDEDILEYRGVDALIYLRTLKMFILLFLLFMPLGLGVLIPVDATARDNLKGVDALSLANLDLSSNRLWAHAAVTVLYTVVTCFVLARFYKSYLKLRIMWNSRDEAHNYTVMFKGIPPDRVNAIQTDQYLPTIFQDTISDVNIAVSAKNLRKLMKEKDKATKHLYFSSMYLSQHQIRPTHRLHIIGKRVDSINYYQTKLDLLDKKIEIERWKLFNTGQPVTQYGFVTFQSIRDAYIHSQILMTDSSKRFRARPAPEARDILWDQLRLSPRYKSTVKPMVYMALFGLIVFWSPLAVILQAWSNVAKLSTLKGLEWLAPAASSNSVITDVIQGFLPPLLLIIFSALLPTILTKIVRVRGVTTRSKVDNLVTSMYYLFLVVNVFLVTALSGGVFGVATSIVDESFTNVISMLGTGIAGQSVFFINYLMVYTLFKYMLNFLRIGDCLSTLVKLASTKCAAERKDAQRGSQFSYPTFVGVNLLIFTIGMAYAPLAAFILPWIALFFIITYITGKYMIMYVHYPKYEGGGGMFPIIFNRIIAGLILSHLAILGVFGLKQTYAVVLIVPLPFLTLYFSHLMRKRYSAPCLYLPLEYFPELTTAGDKFGHDYLDPVLEQYSKFDVESQNFF